MRQPVSISSNGGAGGGGASVMFAEQQNPHHNHHHNQRHYSQQPQPIHEQNGHHGQRRVQIVDSFYPPPPAAAHQHHQREQSYPGMNGGAGNGYHNSAHYGDYHRQQQPQQQQQMPMMVGSPPPAEKCQCCPFGFHIDLGFVKFAEDVAAGKEQIQNWSSAEKKRARRLMASPSSERPIGDISIGSSADVAGANVSSSYPNESSMMSKSLDVDELPELVDNPPHPPPPLYHQHHNQQIQSATYTNGKTSSAAVGRPRAPSVPITSYSSSSSPFHHHHQPHHHGILKHTSAEHQQQQQFYQYGGMPKTAPIPIVKKVAQQMKMTTIALLRPMILSNVTNRMKCQIKKGNNSKHFHNSVCAKNPVAWTMDRGTGTTRNNGNDSKDQKWMTSNLGTKYQMLNGTLDTLQGKLENLELMVENRALKENAEQKANYQALKAELMNHLKVELAKMLVNQNEQHQKEITQLESKYRKLEKKLSAVELQTREMTTKGVIREKLLVNPKKNCWKESNPNFIISRDGLKVGNTKDSRENLCAEKGFDISGDSRQEDCFTGTIIYYFEVKQTSPGEFCIGLSDGSIPDGKEVGECPNSYGLPSNIYCRISGKKLAFEWQEGATKPERIRPSAGDVDGCGLLLSPDNKLAIFFTFDDILIGKPIPISPSVHRLYPTVTMGKYLSLEANFGDDPAKPFSFDIAKCPNLIFP